MGATPPPPMPPHLYGPPIASPLLLHPQHHHHPGLAVPRPPLPVRRPSLSPSPPHNTVIYQPDVMRGHHTTNNAAANQFGIHPPVGPPAAAMFEPEQLHDRPCSRSSVLGTTTSVVPPPPPSGVAPVYNNYGENIINLSRHDPAAAHNFIADRRRSSPDQLSSNGSGGNVNNDSDVQWDCDEQVSGEEPHFFRDAKHFFQESSEALARSPQRPPPQKDCINELSEVIMATWRKRNRKFLKKHGHEPEFRSLPSANTTKTHAELVSSLQSFPLFAPDADTTPFSPTDGTAGGTKKEVSEEVLKRAADFDAIEQETESWFEQHYCAAWTPRFLQRQQTRAEFVDKDGWVRADCCCSTNEGSPESGEDKTGSEGKFGSEERTTSCSVVEVDIQIEVENNVKEPVESSSIVAEKNSSIEKQEAGKKEPEMTFAKIVKKKKPAAISTNAKMNFPPLGVSVTKTGGDRLFLPEPEQPGITASVSLTDAKELPVPQRPKNSPSSTKSQPTKLSWADKMKLSNLPSPNRKRANSGRPKAAGIKPPALA
ncbi:unnamed protein product [Amoebophrya sp. A120]|nr:unnamed protein product [Amoebophrya sp. A120]|eukprot:GSA120T00005708001.1